VHEKVTVFAVWNAVETLSPEHAGADGTT